MLCKTDQVVLIDNFLVFPFSEISKVFQKIKYTLLILNTQFQPKMLLPFDLSVLYNGEEPCRENSYREKPYTIFETMNKSPF